LVSSHKWWRLLKEEVQVSGNCHVRKNFARLQVDRFTPSSATQTVQDMVLDKLSSLGSRSCKTRRACWTLPWSGGMGSYWQRQQLAHLILGGQA
jgi:hypothetical protein